MKPNGILVVSEITWITERRPKEIEDHWNTAYQEIATASSKMKVLEKAGYSPSGFFVLPTSCWLENYYRPLSNQFSKFLQRNQNSAEAAELIEAEKKEITLYETYKSFYSYGMYIAQKREP